MGGMNSLENLIWERMAEFWNMLKLYLSGLYESFILVIHLVLEQTKVIAIHICDLLEFAGYKTLLAF